MNTTQYSFGLVFGLGMWMYCLVGSAYFYVFIMKGFRKGWREEGFTRSQIIGGAILFSVLWPITLIGDNF